VLNLGMPRSLMFTQPKAARHTRTRGSLRPRRALCRAAAPAQSDGEAIAALMSVMRNVSAPFGIADTDRPNVSTTIWQTITDLTDGVLYYDSVVSPQVFWLDVKKLRLTPASPCAR
jgi:penicillin V acylase-like amidase (Ntn superfamily)